MFVLYREIELPLHDNGMEPVEFLKSMGISLTPLNEVFAGHSGSLKVFYFLCTHLMTLCSACPGLQNLRQVTGLVLGHNIDPTTSENRTCCPFFDTLKQTAFEVFFFIICK